MSHSHGSDWAELAERAQNVSKACSRLDFGLVKGMGRQLHGQKACADVQLQALLLVSMMECGCCFPSHPLAWEMMMHDEHLVLHLAKACCDLIPRQQLRREGYMLLDSLEKLLLQAELLGCWSAEPLRGQYSIDKQLQVSGLMQLLPKMMVQTATQLAAEARHFPHTSNPAASNNTSSSNDSNHTTSSSSSNSRNPSTKAMWADGNWQCTTCLLKFATSHFRRWLTGACNAATVAPLLQPSAALAAAVLQYCSQHMQQLPVGQAPPAGIMWLCWFAYTLCHVLRQAVAVEPDSDVCKKMMELPHYLQCIMLLTAVLVHSHLLEDQQGVEICPILQQLHDSSTTSSSSSAEGSKHASSSSSSKNSSSSSSSSPQHQLVGPGGVQGDGPDVSDEWQAIHKEPDVFGSDKWQQACQLQLQLPAEQIALLDGMGWGSRMTTWLALLGNGVVAVDANGNPASLKVQAVRAALAYRHAVTLRRKAAQQRPAQQFELQQHQWMPVLLMHLLKSSHTSREQPLAWEPVGDAFGAAVESWVELARGAAEALRPALKAMAHSQGGAAATAAVAAAAASDAPAYPVPVLQHILVLLTQLLQHELQQLLAAGSSSSSGGDSGSSSNSILAHVYVLEAISTVSRVLSALEVVTDGSRSGAAADLQRATEWAPFTVRLTALLELFVRSEQHEIYGLLEAEPLMDRLVFGLLRPACGTEEWLKQLLTEEHNPACARMGMGILASPLTVAAAYSAPGSPQQLQLFSLLCSSFKLCSRRQCGSLYFAISCTCAAAKTVVMQICRQLRQQQQVPHAEAAADAGAVARAAEPLQVNALLPWVVLLGRCLGCCVQALDHLLSSGQPSEGAPDNHSHYCKWIVRLWANAAYSVELLVVMLLGMPPISDNEHQAASAGQQQQASSHEAAAAGRSSRADAELRADLKAAGQQLSQHLLALGFNMQDHLLKPLQTAWSSILMLQSFMLVTINTYPQLLGDPFEDEYMTGKTAGSRGAATKQPKQYSPSAAPEMLAALQQNSDLACCLRDLGMLASHCCLLPIHQACNNPACSNLSGQSEAQLVSGRSCICAGCRKARYCSKACQATHWRSHKLVCSSFRQAAAAGQAGA